jgi:protein-L-isoaspartate(D-aspartate) O-methyltransferase
MDADGNSAGTTHNGYEQARHEMVETQIRKRHVTNNRVLDCLGEGQTISQPYIVAAMTAALRVEGDERVLEIGTGFGYQAAVLACLAKEVYSVEFRAALATQATERLARLGYTNVHVHCGDGTLGLAEFAPYDAILVAAAAPSVPAPLLAQLAEGGRMIVPVGGAENQDLRLIERQHDTFHTTVLEPCRFVPLLGAHGWKESSQR